MSKTIIAVKAVGNSDNFSKELRDLEVGKTEAFDNYCEDKRTLNLEDFETVDSCISSTLEHGEEMTELQQISAYTDGLESENTKSADSPP
ncbi:hypothetical protein V1477_019459 [Vespula maculifrons]|uniref:Uncharacterized protein n=1 Tax=Vespula maculifrons TaxID=7453 RepID=A0ABD2ASJ6_VESMC